MSRENNNNDRPKRPRIPRKGSSEDSQTPRRAGRNFDSRDKYEKGDLKFGKKPYGKSEDRDQKSGDSFERKSYSKSDNRDARTSSDKKPYDRDSRSGSSYEKKPYGKSDSRDSRSGSSYEKKPYGKSDSRDSRSGSSYDKKPYKKYEDRNEDKARSFVQKRRFEKIEKDLHKDTIRLNKYIANSGICSRREADELIKQGLVEVNGKVVTEMGYQVQKTDKVIFDGQGITPEKPVYVLLNKPKGYISTTKDEKARKTVMDLVANASPYRLYPVGRLDRSTTGVILLTNDGHMTKKLTHPSFDVKKIYHVTLDRKLSTEDMQTIVDGIRLEEGVVEVDHISYIEGKPKNEIGIEIHIGWNRVIRRIFQKLGYEVEGLDRVMFAGMTKKNIKRGHWRILTELEVNNLKML